MSLSYGLTLILSIGIYMAMIYNPRTMKIKSSLKGRIRTLATNEFQEANCADYYNNLDLPIGFEGYNYFRLALIFSLMIIAIIKGFTNGFDIKVMCISIVIILALAVITLPIGKIGKRKSPFSKIAESIVSNRNLKLDREIYQSCVSLKNLAVMGKEGQFTTDFILQQLFDEGDRIRPCYGQVLRLYRNGKSQEAFQYFGDTIGTKASRSFALLLGKLDKIDVSQLVEQIDTFQEIILEQRYTREIKLTDKKSLVVTAFSTASIFALLLNFAMVVVFMDTLNMLSQLY